VGLQLQEERQQIHQGIHRSAKEAASWMKREVLRVQNTLGAWSGDGVEAARFYARKEKGRTDALQVHRPSLSENQ
jgi:hypothetical protein